ncbi:MAG: L-threonine 3-dehydrogenase [Candidatus Brocadiae bacterium]|nr:L-threonine 3-dehydrogenase [Candidatus Brocadiia bacterium]
MKGTMKAIAKQKAAPGATLVEVPIPQIGNGELLVQVRGASICGTDVHIYEWDEWAQSRIKPPLVTGHECCGHIVEIGPGVTGFAEGDLVSLESHIPCGLCAVCRTGLQHICTNLKILGVDTPGVYADYVKIPAICAWKHDPKMPIEIATVFEPMGNAVYASLCEPISGCSVAIMGCGPVGLFATMVCRAAGAGPIYAVDIDANRLEMARSFGAHETLDAKNGEEAIRRMLAGTGGDGVDVVLEMSGAPSAIRTGFKVLRKGGRFTAFGLPSKPVEIDFNNDIIFKGARVIGINGREMFQTWYKMAGLVRSGTLDPRPVITHTFALTEFDRAMTTMRSREGKVGKVMLIP